eukprot:2880139-Rhodomonas_salina.1
MREVKEEGGVSEERGGVSQQLPSRRGQGRVSWGRGGEGKGILFDRQGEGRSTELEHRGARVSETEG